MHSFHTAKPLLALENTIKPLAGLTSKYASPDSQTDKQLELPFFTNVS